MNSIQGKYFGTPLHENAAAGEFENQSISADNTVEILDAKQVTANAANKVGIVETKQVTANAASSEIPDLISFREQEQGENLRK